MENNNMFLQAVSAINLLRDGIVCNNKHKIKAAFDVIESEFFSWKNLEVVQMEWDDLTVEANNILNDNPMEVTVARLEEFNDINKAINWAVEQYRHKYIPIPKKPVLNRKHTSAEAEAYVYELKAYEINKANWDAFHTEYQKEKAEIADVIKLYLMNVAGVFTTVPEQYRENVWSKAWQDGHINGYYDVYLHLCGLVKIFDVK